MCTFSQQEALSWYVNDRAFPPQDLRTVYEFCLRFAFVLGTGYNKWALATSNIYLEELKDSSGNNNNNNNNNKSDGVAGPGIIGIVKLTFLLGINEQSLICCMDVKMAKNKQKLH